MATLYATQMTKILNTVPPTFVHAGDMHGRLRVFNEYITLATQTTSDIIYCARVPKHARILGVSHLQTTITLGAATLSVGISGSVAKYKVAATITTVAPSFYDAVSNLGTELTAKEDLYLTIAAASLPASGTLRMVTIYTVD